MGTCAAFWVGVPLTTQTHTGIMHYTPNILLGCVAWDGHPENFPELKGITGEQAFRRAVRENIAIRDDWTPGRHGFPFPWRDDLFLTDFNYIYSRRPNLRRGAVFASCYRSGLVPFDDAYDWCVSGDRVEDNNPFRRADDALPKDFPVRVGQCKPGRGKDSIIILRAGA
jgi:hypothetical protein